MIRGLQNEALPVGVALILALQSCSTACGPFDAGWYVIYPSAPVASGASAPAPAKPEIYLGLMHNANRTLDVDSIVLNRSADATDFRLDRTFESQGLEPGRVYVRNVSDFKRVVLPGKAEKESFGKCRVPIRVELTCVGERRPQQARLYGAMPNALVDEWLNGDCALPL